MPLQIYDLTTRYPETHKIIENAGLSFLNNYNNARKRRLEEQALEADNEATKITAQHLQGVLRGVGPSQEAPRVDVAENEADVQRLERGQMADQGFRLPTQPGAAFPASLIRTESGGNWQAQNQEMGSGGKAGHFGRLQFGQARLQDAMNAGAIPQGITPMQFLASPELQQRAEQWHFADIDKNIRANGLDKMIGQPINGQPLTQDGMRAVAHLGGFGGLKKYVESGGRYNPADANGTSLADYARTHAGSTQAAPQPQQAQQQGQTSQPTLSPYLRSQAEAAMQMMQSENPALRNRGVALAQQVQQSLEKQPYDFKTVGDQLVRVNPRTGQYEAVMQKPMNPLDEEGKRLANERARLEIEQARKGGSRSQPASVQEYEYAKANGYNGSFMDFERDRSNSRSQRQSVSEVNAEREKEADRLGLDGEDKKQYVINGKLPTSSEKLTNDQANAGLYADRMRKSNAIFDTPGYANAQQTRFNRIAGNNLPAGAASLITSDEYKMVEQAERDFINATLRRESGAAIGQGEFENARLQYFPQPGDPPALLKQKKENRQIAIDGISRAGGPSYAKANPPGTVAKTPDNKPRPEPENASPQRPESKITPPPIPAVNRLKANPHYRDQFDEKYGKGAADMVLKAR